MNELKKKKYFTLLLVVLLVISIIALVSQTKIDKYKGLVKVSNTGVKSKLAGSIGGATLEENTAKGNSTIEYIVSFTLDEIDGVEERDALIKASLTEEEFKYARFKPINGSNIESTLKENGKEIEVLVKNVRLGQEKTIKLKLIIENAPNTVEIHPNLKVSESTGSYTTLETETITVETNSLEGQVKDEKDLPVGNIEVVVRKNGQEIKKAYTNENGNYVITDLETGTYELDVDEEIYEAKKETVEVNGRSKKNLRVKSVEPYKIETHKYITRLKLIIDGEEKEYTYEDKEKVLESIRRANTISGEIEYKLVVKNVGEKSGTISRVEDIASEGLKLKEGNNGWEEVEGTYYYRPLEGVTLKKNETREVGLVLEIESTSAAKTYINKMTTKGEIYEKVVYVLDGEVYKEEEVLEGEKIEEPIIGEDFSGWYTDKNRSNKYNFNLPVEKDLILYGVTNVRMCEVKFIDFGSLYNRQEIVCGTKAIKPTDPEHEGYEFIKWTDEDNIEFDPDVPIDNDVIYNSDNKLIEYNIVYEGLTDDEKNILNNPTKYTIESETISLNDPQNRVDADGDPSEAFVGWIPKNETTPTTPITIPKGSTGDRKYTASWVDIAPDEYTITYDLDGGHLEEGKSNPSSYNKKTETFTLNNPVKDYYEFTGWVGTDLNEPTMTVTINKGSIGNRHYEATYRPTIYHITYDLRDGHLEEGKSNPTEYTVETPDITLNNPSKEGHDFVGWNGSNGDNPETTVVIPQGSHGDKSYVANYEIQKFTVTYMDGNQLFGTETNIPYGSYAQGTANTPTKAHNVFIAWTLDGNVFDFEHTPVTHDITLYSSFKEVIAPNVTHTPTEWTNQYVTVTIGLEGEQYNNYSYYYSVDGGAIQEYKGPFTLDYNCDVSAHSMDSGVSSVEVLHPITNIDKDPPIIDSLELDYALTTSAKISFSSHDVLSGLKEIKIYKDNVYQESINYNPDTTSLQTEEYTFNGLEDGRTYTVKLVAYDYAGNISEERTLDITTEQEEAIVCRLIGYDNVDYDCEENPSLCKTFPTLKSALEYTGDQQESDTRNCLTNKCYIQMLESVVESNNIAGGQTTKLDLNGKTINGIGEYTFNIAFTGDLTVVDHATFDEQDYNESNHNSIKNDISTAILNNGVFTLGEGRDGNDVSTYVPLIKGKSTGVNSVNGTFNFYDGRIIATTAISGEVDDAPDMYSANVEIKTQDEETIQVATLKKVSDVEARIGTKYYTKVALAMDDAKNGGWYDILTDDEFVNSFDTTGDYGFVKEGNYLVSENDEKSTTAQSSFVMDLENYDYDQIFTYSVNKTKNPSSYSSDSYSDIVIYEGTDSTGTRVSGSSFNEGESSKSIKLAKGKKYFIEIRHTIYYDNHPEDSKFYITNMTLNDYIEALPPEYYNLETTTVSKNYGFDYDTTTGIFKSNNQYTSQTTAFGYYEIDLTNESSNKLLIVNASLSTYGSHIGSIHVKTNNNSESYNNYNSSLLTLYGYGSDKPTITGPMTASTTLQAGQKYYVQFYYYKQYDTKTQSEYENAGVSDQFIINSLDIVDVADWSTDLPFANMIQTPGDRGFTVNSYTYASTSGITHSYVPISLPANSPDEYVELDFYSYYDFRVFVTESAELPSNLDGFEYQNPTPNDSNSYYGPITLNLKKGVTNYIHFYMPASNNGTANLKTLKIKPGKAYSITNDVKKSSGVSNGFDSYRTGDSIAVYSKNVSSADSYVEIDLRNNTVDEVLSVDQILPSDGTAYMYVTDGKNAIDVNSILPSTNPINKELLLKYSYSNNGHYYGTSMDNAYYNTRTYNFVLSKGKKYYLHFGFSRSSSYYNYYVNKIITRPVGGYNTKTGKQRLIPQSGSSSELPSDMIIDENNYNNLRYIGSSANNYVSFNGEIWRIIGVFNTEDENGVVKPRIKLVRNESLGQLSWDAFDTGMNSTGLDGYNEWSQAKLMKLMNPGYDSEDTNNSLYWNRASGNCLYYDSSTYSKSNSCDFSSNGLTTTSQSMIDKVVWYTSPIVQSNSENITPYQLYDAERNGTTLGYNLTTEHPSWTGYVGLAYMSDYIMASDGIGTYTRNQCMTTPGTSYTTCVGNNSWMRGDNSPYATINPLKLSDTYTGGPVFYQAMATRPYTSPTYQSYQVMPSVYLSSKIEITGGEGTAINPYTLSLGDTDNEKMNNYYGLIPEPEDTGEIIDYETDDYNYINGAPVYGFEFQGYYVSTNAYAGASTAAAYIEIDRRTELEDKMIKFTYDKSSAQYSNGVIIIVPDEYDSNIDVNSYNTYEKYQNYSVYDVETTTLINFPAGHKYYVVFGFVKNYSDTPSSSYRENMRVKVDGLEITPKTTTVTKYNGIEMKYNEEVDTIQILKNINMPSGLVVEETKDVILDLNGYSLTTYSSDPVITNNGKLTIIDSGENGTIISSQTDTIKNNATGKLDFQDGTIYVNNNKAGVYNLGEVTIGEEGSIIIDPNNNGIGIDNYATGNIKDGLGTISNGYGIKLETNNSDTAFGGYTLNNSYISIGITTPVTISDLKGTAKINIGNGEVTINNSEFESASAGGYSATGNHAINGSTFDTLTISDSINIIDFVVNNSNVGTVVNKGKNTTINNSVIDTIENGLIDSGSSYGIGTLVVNDSIINNDVSNKYILTIKGESEVNGEILNYRNLILGDNDGTINSVYPRVEGLVHAINNNQYYIKTNFKYYDGSLTGDIDTVVAGSINEIAPESTVVRTKNGDRETYTLEHKYICAIGSNKYYSLQEAVDSITTSEEVEIDILEDLIDATKTTIPEGKNVKIDFDGHQLHLYSNNWITNNGTVTIYSSKTAEDSISYATTWITNNGTFINDNINLIIDDRKNSNKFIVNNGTFTMNDGSIKIIYDATDNNSGHLIFDNKGTVNINGGTLQSFRIAENGENATFNINDGNIYSYYFNKSGSYSNVVLYDCVITSSGIVNINGGTFDTLNANESNNNYYYTIKSTGTVNVTGGTFNKKSYLLINEGTAIFNGVTNVGFATINNRLDTSILKFKDTEFVAGTITMSIINDGQIEMDGVTKPDGTQKLSITSDSLSIANSNINNITTSASLDTTITDSTFTKAAISTNGTSTISGSTMTDSSMSASGNTTILSSTIKSNGEYAIKNYDTLTLGSKDGNVSDTIPNIEGATYGIYNQNNTTFNFYDGVITGQKNNSVYGTISDIETGYDVISFDIDSTRESTILSSSIIVENIDTHQTYSSIQTAIDEAGSGQTLQLLRNYNYISGNSTITIPATKNIIFDLNGHNIDNRTSNVFTISNLGTLSILDGSGVTSNYIFNSTDENSVFENSGTLSLTVVTVNGTLTNTSTGGLNTTGANIKKLENHGQAILGPTLGPSTGVTCTIELINNYASGDLTTNAQMLVKELNNYGHTETNRTSVSKLNNLDSGVMDINHILGPTGLSQVFTFKDNSVATFNNGDVDTPIGVEGSSKVIVKDGDYESFVVKDDAELILEGGDVSSYRNTPIVSTSSKPITLGVKDGTININSPYIRKRYLYGTGYRAISGDVNFYDGKAYVEYGEYEPIFGTIVDKEVNHNVVIDDHAEYLSPDPIAKNTRTTTEYTDFALAISETQSGDELQILQSFVNYSNFSINSGDNLSIDLNGKRIYGSYSITNDGTFTIENGSMEDGNVTSTGTLNVNTNGKIGTISSTGTVNITSGTTGTVTNTGGILNITNGSTGGINNTGTVTVNGGYVNTVENTGTFTMNNGNTADLRNTGTVTVLAGKLENIYNNQNGNILLKDGNITITSIVNKDYLKIENANINVKVTGKNYSSDTIIYGVINNTDIIDVDGASFTFTTTGSFYYDTAYLFLNGYNQYRNDSSLEINTNAILNIDNVTTDVPFLLKNVGTVNIDSSNISGYIDASTISYVGSSSGVLNIDNSTLGSIYGAYTTTINDSIINDALYVSDSTINRSTINANVNHGYGTLNINDNTVINGNLTVGNVTNLNNTSSINGHVSVENNRQFNIAEGTTITSTDEYAIDNKGTTIIGVKDGNYNANSPQIKGTTYGITTTGTLKFYDGVIIGSTAVTGLVSDVETNYVIDISVVDGLQNERLKIPGEHERVIVYNNINYTSLQAAVNASIEGVTNEMILYTDYTLTSDVSIPDNRTIKLYLNGFNLNYDGHSINTPSTSSFVLDSGAPTGIGGAIYKFFANLTNTPVNPKNVIINQMEDGQSLSSTETYKLYKLVDNAYKIVSMSEDELGEYSYSGRTEQLRTIKGKLYLNGLDSGSYKLVSDNRRELDFTIEENGVSSNIRENFSSPKAKVESSAVAILILTFSTGIIRTPWLFFLLAIIIMTLTTIVIVKRRNPRLKYQEIDRK